MGAAQGERTPRPSETDDASPKETESKLSAGRAGRGRLPEGDPDVFEAFSAKGARRPGASRRERTGEYFFEKYVINETDGDAGVVDLDDLKAFDDDDDAFDLEKALSDDDDDDDDEEFVVDLDAAAAGAAGRRPRKNRPRGEGAARGDGGGHPTRHRGAGDGTCGFPRRRGATRRMTPGRWRTCASRWRWPRTATTRSRLVGRRRRRRRALPARFGFGAARAHASRSPSATETKTEKSDALVLPTTRASPSRLLLWRTTLPALGRPKRMNHYLRDELYRKNRARGVLEFLEPGSLDGIWYWDRKDREHEWLSPKFKRVFRYEDHGWPSTLLVAGRGIFAEDLPRGGESFERHVDEGAPYDQGRAFLRTVSALPVWIRCRGMVIRDRDGRGIRMTPVLIRT